MWLIEPNLLGFACAQPNLQDGDTQYSFTLGFNGLLTVIAAGGGIAAGAGPVGVEEFAPGSIHPLVGVRAKVIALGLQEISGQPGAAQAVEIVERGGQARRGNAVLRG